MLETKISVGNTKLGRIINVNLPPVKSCCKDVPCSGDKCYALKAYRQYPKTRKAWDTNYELYQIDSNRYFECISNYLEKRRKYVRRFRWHSSGDIIDQKYFNYMIEISKNFPEIKFLCFTKNYNLEYDVKELPYNFVIRFSMWPGFSPEIISKNNIYAWMDDGKDTRIPKNAFKCFNSCKICGFCWNNNNRDVVFHKH